jgi:hypothetical protein
MTGRLLTLLFFLLYAGCGVAFHRASPMAFAYLDQLFDADVPSRVIDMTRFAGPHHRTQFHPLFVLVTNPPGVALKTALRAVGVEQAGRMAAMLLCALAGGAGVGVFFTLLRRSGLASAIALPWSLVFGLSSSQWFFAVFPETYVFSALALLVVFAQGGGPGSRVAAGVLAFGMNVLNLGATALARGQALEWKGTETEVRRASLGAVARHLLLVLVLGGALSLVQSIVYEGTAPFWTTGALARDDRLSFVWPRSAGDAAARGGELAAYFFSWNLAAPRTVVSAPDPPRKVVDFPPAASASLRPAGIAHGFVWGALVVLALASALRTAAGRCPRCVALALWILGLLGLHLVFGTSLFLYTAQWTFAVLGLVALLLKDGSPTKTPVRVFQGALFLLGALQVVINAEFLLEIARTFA